MSEFTANPQQRSQEHQELVAYKQNLIASSMELTETQLAQEKELFDLGERWDKNHKDIEHEAAQKKVTVLELLDSEVPSLEKNGVKIPVDAALLSLKGINIRSNRRDGIEATNMAKLKEPDMQLVGYSVQRGIQGSFLGFHDLYDAGTSISDYAVDSTQRPSARDPRLRRRMYIARLPLAMTAARVIPEMKSTFKLTQFVPDKSGQKGVYEIAENQPTPRTAAQVKEWQGGMRTLKGGLDFSVENVQEGEYTLEALTAWAAEWSVNVEIIMVKDCTDKIANGAPTKDIDWASLSEDDILKIANTFLFTNEDYAITTLAMSDEATYNKYAKVARATQYRESMRSDLGYATGRDNFRMAMDRNVFAHPGGGIAVDNALGWDAGKTINVHTRPVNATRSMIITFDPEFYCFRWGVKFGTAFELQEGTPRRLFN